MSQYEYDEATAERYDAAVPLGDGEIGFWLEYAREAQERGEPTLELACGTGRVMIPLTREGIPITGIDTSTAMLEVGRKRCEGLDNARWLEGDMRSFDLGEKFGLIMIPSGSIHLLDDTDEQMQCLRACAGHLTADGRLIIELVNPNVVALGEALSTKAGVLQRHSAREFRHPRTGLNVRPWITREYHPSTQKLVNITRTDEVDDDGRVVETRYSSMTLRLIFRFEMEHMLARCGLEVDDLFGDFNHSPYRGASDEMIFVARKAS